MEVDKMGLTKEQTAVIMSEFDKLNEQIEQLRRRSEIETMLYDAGARNVKACSALIDDNKAEDIKTFKEDIENQIKSLKKNEKTGFLFYDEKIGRKGFIPAESPDKGQKQLSYEELCRIM